MDFIRALQQSVPAVSSLGGTAVPPLTDIPELFVQDAQSALVTSVENGSACSDANGMSGGLSHFLEAKLFLSRSKQLVCSTRELCGRVREKDEKCAVQAVRAPEKLLTRRHRSSAEEKESTGIGCSDSAKLVLPPENENDRCLAEIDNFCTREDVSRTHASIKDSVSAVAFCVATLEIYQSQPTLLDAHLVDIVGPLSHTVASNLDLVTPLLASDLQAKLSAILSKSSQYTPSMSSHSGTSSGSFPSLSSCPPCSPPLFLPEATCSASASSCAASSSIESCASSSSQSLPSEKYSRSLANREQSSLSTSLSHACDTNVAGTCIRMSHARFVTSSEPHCFYDNKWRLLQQLEELYLRTAASLALRLLMHLLYVVSKVRGYKHLRQLLPSEPELLEVLVDHCEQLLDAEFPQARRPTSAVDTYPTVSADVSDASTSHGQLQQSDDHRDCQRFITSSRGLAGEDAHGGKAERENPCLPCSVPMLVQHTQNLLDLLQQLPLWSTHYYLLVWLSLLVLAPFDLETLDSSGSVASHTQQQTAEASFVVPPCGQLGREKHERMPAADELAQEELRDNMGGKGTERQHQSPLGFRLIALVEGYLRRTSGKASDAAAFVVARFFSRPDVGTKATGTLSAFLHFCQGVLDGVRSKTGISTPSQAAPLFFSDRVSPADLENTVDSVPLFAKANALRAVNEILKNISRESALPELPRLLHLLNIRRDTSPQEPTVEVEEKETRDADAAAGLETAAKSALFRKLQCSCAARICMLLLPPLGSGVYQWRYTAHARDLEAHLKQSQQQMMQQQGTQLGDRESTADSATEAMEHHDTQHDVHEEDVPEAVEEVINLLLESLADRDTIVRWAAAKAIGRVVLQLPQSFASQVVGSILENMEMNTSCRTASAERLWHGSCLALGELLRRGLVNPEEHLHACTTRLCYALSLDTSESLGYAHTSTYMTATATAEQLRDAACFAVWSLARAYYHRSETVKQQIEPLSEALLLVALFDREVNCRRAAAAAFQELEGRQGGIRRGLQIVTTADFFALATRRSSYLKVAPQVAALDHSYCVLLLNTLMKLLLQQIDEEMRTLAAAAIRRIAGLINVSALQLRVSSWMWLQQYMDFLLKKATAERENLTTRHGALLGLTALLEALETSIAKKSTERAPIPHKERDLSRKGASVTTEVAATPSSEMWGSTSVRDIDKKAEKCDQYALPIASETKALCLTAHLNGEACAAPEEISPLFEDKLQTSLRQLVITVEKQRLYRGKGGDMIRTAVCRFIHALTTSEYITFKRATARRYMATLMEGLRHFSDAVQLAAAETLRALLRLRLSREEVEIEVVPELLQRLQNPSENVAARRGYTLALATLPEDVYRSIICTGLIQQRGSNHAHCVNLLEYLQTESVSFAPLGRPSLRDAQTRRNALIALAFTLRALLNASQQEKISVAVVPQRKPGNEGVLMPAAHTRTPLERRRPTESPEIQSLRKGNRETVDCEDVEARETTRFADFANAPVAAVGAPIFSPAAAESSCCRHPVGATTQLTPPPPALSTHDVEAPDSSFNLVREQHPNKCNGTSDTCVLTEGGTERYNFEVSSQFLESICNTLESCSADYQVDRRGDVGSWVREVAAEVAAFLLENPRISCEENFSCRCTNQTESGLEIVADNEDAEVVDVKYMYDESQKCICIKARLLSLLIRLSLENLDRTRSRAVFLLYHLMAPLPASYFHTFWTKAFKVEWIWSRVFYDFSYEAVSANLTPRPDLLRAGSISPCLAMPSQGRVGEQQAPFSVATTGKTTETTGLTFSLVSAASRATVRNCGLLMMTLQHVLVPLAEEQTNALESVKPQMPFHNLNLSEFAVVNASSGCVSAGSSTGKKYQTAPTGGVTAVPMKEDTSSRRQGAAVGEGGGEDKTFTPSEATPSLGSEVTTNNSMTDIVEGTEHHANISLDNEEVEKTQQMESAFDKHKSSLSDFLLEVSVGDGGRASLHRTRKAGVLLRLPLFTDPAMTYPRLLLSLLMPPPFSYAAAQGLCLGVGALAGSTSDRAAQALLGFLTQLRQAGSSSGDGIAATIRKATQIGAPDLHLSEKTQEKSGCSTGLLFSSASKRAEQQKAVTDAIPECGNARSLYEGEAAIHKVGSIVVNVLEDSATQPTRDARRHVHRSDLHSDKLCLAALKTLTLISGFLPNNEVTRVVNLLLNTLNDGIWRRSYQYAKARCEALIALLSAAGTCISRGCPYNSTAHETAEKAAAETQTVYKKALCTVLQYLTHSFPKLRQLAAEELYASLLLPLSTIHGQWTDHQIARDTDSAAPAEDAEVSARSGVGVPAISPLFAHITRQVEDASQVVIGTPWMEIRASDTEPIDRLVDLFDVRAEWA